MKYISPLLSFSFSFSSSLYLSLPPSLSSNWRCNKGVWGQWFFKVRPHVCLTLMFSLRHMSKPTEKCPPLQSPIFLLPPPHGSKIIVCTSNTLIHSAHLSCNNFLSALYSFVSLCSMLPALLSQPCSMSLCQPVKPEGTLWVNQRQSSANTPSGRGPAKGAKASREREVWKDVREEEKSLSEDGGQSTQNNSRGRSGRRVWA